jgi:hypothetical protein
MREGSPNNLLTADPKRGSRPAQPGAKSLFRHILAASPLGSVFWPDSARSATHKLLRMNILADPEEKIVGGEGVTLSSKTATRWGVLAGALGAVKREILRYA